MVISSPIRRAGSGRTQAHTRRYLSLLRWSETSQRKSENKSYFKSIAMVKVNGVEFESAYGAFRTGLDQNEAIPVGYRLDATSVSGKSLKLYFFDYGSSAWGSWCRETCAPDSRFMLLNMAQRPNKTFNPTPSLSASPRVN